MRNWHSGNPDEIEEQLLTSHLPLLAVAAVSLPLLFVVVTVASRTVLVVQFLVYLALAALYLWGAFERAQGLLRVVAMLFTAVIPIMMLIGGFRLEPSLSMHGIALAAFAALAWGPVYIVKEIARIQLARLQGEELPTGKRGPRSNTNITLILLLIAGSLVFIGASLPGSQFQTDLFVVAFFAIPFYLCIFALLSLAKLLQKAGEIPHHPITVSGNFVRQWISGLLMVLLLGAVLATLIPKNPLYGLFDHWAIRRMETPIAPQREAQNNQEPFYAPRKGQPPVNRQGDPEKKEGTGEGPQQHPQPSPEHGQGEATGDGTPTSGQGKGAQGEGESPAMQAVRQVQGKALDAMRAISRVGEPPSPAEAGEPQQSGSQGQQVTKQDVARKSEQLKRDLHENPWRLVKLILIPLLALALLVAGLLLLRNWWRKKRAQAVEETVTLARNPFDNPFDTMPDASPGMLAEAAYETMLAYLWIAGYKRKPEQTEYAFATWVEMNTPLDSAPVWTITRHGARVTYGDTPLIPADLNELNAALPALIAQTTKGMTEEMLKDKQEAYLATLRRQAATR